MTYHRLFINGFISPLWWRSVEGKRFELVAGPDGTVDLLGEILTDCPYPEGTPLRVQVTNNVECVSMAEYNQDQERIRLKWESEDAKIKDKLNKAREESKEFYAAHYLPFRYSTAITGHLHGLTERSSGNGWTRNTVIHLLLQEDIQIGKLKRKAGQKLCASEGKDYSGCDSRPHLQRDGDNAEFMPMVTCKKCLSIISKWKYGEGKK